MSLRSQDFSRVPEDTARVARAAFPEGNPYLTLRDELGVIYEDEMFAPCLPARVAVLLNRRGGWLW